jgi:hypothetical protein
LLALLASLAALAAGAEERAIAWLAREVPSWPEQNHCFSCHNNGDAARALFTAQRLGYKVSDEVLASTLGWLRRPSQWDSLPGDPAFSDKRLARIQFAAALAEAVESGLIRDRAPLAEAIESLLAIQHANGSWPLDGGDVLGAPVTYGIPLATAMALRALGRDNPRAIQYLRSVRPASTPAAAAVVLAVGSRRPEAVDFLLRAQGSSGGWGPYPASPPEPFDTAVAMLALARLRERPDIPPRLERGRAWLVRTQLPEGHWAETTRPPGGQSYSQRVSTTAWALLALLTVR